MSNEIKIGNLYKDHKNNILFMVVNLSIKDLSIGVQYLDESRQYWASENYILDECELLNEVE